MFSQIVIPLKDQPESQRALRPKNVHADQLVIGLHQHDFYLSRLWSSVYDLAQDATCSVLGVH